MAHLSLSSPFQIPKSAILSIAITLWLLVAVLHIGLFIIDHYVDYFNMLAPCEGVWTIDGGDCDWIVLSTAEETVLQSWGLSLQHYAVSMITISMLTLTIYVGLGILILWRTGITWFGLLVSIALVNIPYAIVSGSARWETIHSFLIYPGMVANIIGNLSQVMFLYLLPNGRLSSRWAIIPLSVTVFLLMPLDLINSQLIPYTVAPIVILILIGCILLGAILQVYRYFYDSTPTERQQTRWILVSIVAYVASIMLWIMVFGRALDIPVGEARVIANVVNWYIIHFVLMLLPIAIAIAILRYNLWNIDIIINRTLVFGGLSAMIVVLYTLIVGGMSVLFQSSNNVFISIFATALIALVFQPARDRLQGTINRLMFGERDNPYTVLSNLSKQLQSTAKPSETLKTIVETIARTLKLPYVAIELTDKDTIIGGATTGKPIADETELPLRYQNELVGYLRVSPRAKDETFTLQEDQLFTDIAAQIAPVASATRLTMALQQSRENLVLAREEERRRIRRDLHDGLGPTLASQTLSLEAISQLMKTNPDKAQALLKAVQAQADEAIQDVRRLVYDLRPPALDDLGLAGALEQVISRYENADLHIVLSIIDLPDELPAAIETAFFRIAQEALTNVVRHSQANRCTLRIYTTHGVIQMDIEDNGRGIPDNYQSGVGLHAMRERASELGGETNIHNKSTGGTLVNISIPLGVNDD